MDRYKALQDWLKSYTPLASWIYFNVTPLESDNTSLQSVSSVREINKFNDNSREVGLQFAITLVKNFSTGTTTTNLQAMQEFQSISEWVEKQNNLSNFPDFDGDIISEVKSLQTNPDIAIDNTLQLAKYQGQFEIIYLERS